MGQRRPSRGGTHRAQRGGGRGAGFAAPDGGRGRGRGAGRSPLGPQAAGRAGRRPRSPAGRQREAARRGRAGWWEAGPGPPARWRAEGGG